MMKSDERVMGVINGFINLFRGEKMKDYHCCATCIHFGIEKTEEGIKTKCMRLGYDTEPNYQFNCWVPKERVRRAMEKMMKSKKEEE